MAGRLQALRRTPAEHAALKTANIARIGLGWYAVLVVAMIAGFFLHEVAHWLTGEALGYDMGMSIGRAWPTGETPGPAHAQLISAAGPMFTILVAIAGALIALLGRQVWGYALVFSSMMMRFAAFVVSFMNLNDEARISEYLGLNWWVLPAIVVGILLAMTVWVSRKLGIGWRTNVLAYVVSSLIITSIVFLDGQLLVPAE